MNSRVYLVVITAEYHKTSFMWCGILEILRTQFRHAIRPSKLLYVANGLRNYAIDLLNQITIISRLLLILAFVTIVLLYHISDYNKV